MTVTDRVGWFYGVTSPLAYHYHPSHTATFRSELESAISVIIKFVAQLLRTVFPL
jgi:hypothetical protein